MKRPTVLYVQYSQPAAYPPILHSARMLAESGWRVTVLGIGLMGVRDIEFQAHPQIDVHVRPWCAPGWRQKLHYATFLAWVMGYVLIRRPEWVYVSDALAAPVGRLIATLTRVAVLYHEHDAPVAGRNSWFARLIDTSRQQLLGAARVVVVPNAERATRLQAIGGSTADVRVVWNCPAESEIAPHPRPAVDRQDFWLLYHGTIVPARVPLTLVDALAELPSFVKLRVRGYETIGNVGHGAALLERAASLGIRDRVEIQPFVKSREQLLTLVDDCDLGLALMPSRSDDENEQHMTGASNKIFDYLSRGMPALVTDLPEWKRIFVDGGFARACRPEDPATIAAQIRWFVEHRAETRAMGEAGRQRIAAEWNYEQQFEPILRLMQNAQGAGVHVHAH